MVTMYWIYVFFCMHAETYYVHLYVWFFNEKVWMAERMRDQPQNVSKVILTNLIMLCLYVLCVGVRVLVLRYCAIQQKWTIRSVCSVWLTWKCRPNQTASNPTELNPSISINLINKKIYFILDIISNIFIKRFCCCGRCRCYSFVCFVYGPFAYTINATMPLVCHFVPSLGMIGLLLLFLRFFALCSISISICTYIGFAHWEGNSNITDACVDSCVHYLLWLFGIIA